MNVLAGQQGLRQGFQKVKNARFPAVAQAEHMIIVDDIDHIGRVGQAVAPGGKGVGRKGPCGPGRVGKTQAHVVGKAGVAQQQAKFRGADGLVQVVGAAPAQHLIRALGQHGLEAEFGHSGGEVVVVHAFRMLEGHGLDAEELFQAGRLCLHLAVKLLAGVEKGQGMRRGFGHKFHAARLRQGRKAIKHFRNVLLKEVKGCARNGEGHAKVLAVAADELEHELIGGQVAQACRAQHGIAVVVIVFINGILTHIKNRIAA